MRIIKNADVLAYSKAHHVSHQIRTDSAYVSADFNFDCEKLSSLVGWYVYTYEVLRTYRFPGHGGYARIGVPGQAAGRWRARGQAKSE